MITEIKILPTRNIIIAICLTIVFYISLSSKIYSQEIRPIRDDVGFCWTVEEINMLMKLLAENDKSNFPSENLIAAITPHDDFLYAGMVYAPLFKLINSKEVVIFGVTHGTARHAMNDPQNILILDEYDFWKGPYKNVKISPLREKIKAELESSYFIVSNKAHSVEHSIEALIPFLQYYNRNIRIMPIMVTQMSLERMNKISSSLSDIMINYMNFNNLKPGKDIFFLISSDANHYGEDFDNAKFGEDLNAHEKATSLDKQIAEESFSGEITDARIKSVAGKLWKSDNNKDISLLWCGRYTIVFGLSTVSQIAFKLGSGNISGKVFKYSDTFTEGVLPLKGTTLGITAPFSLKHWVGFFSAGFYINRN
ncbi:MAG: AmmeMemoRadiSam system protein B [Melioribacteraceae bacterium]|nr:AmmeMemoRadiSam system protein B [Melioribacteraceae bacterium]